MKSWTEWKKRELLALPVRNWSSDTAYDFLLIVPTRMKHDSGFTRVAIIGCLDGMPNCICAMPDDIMYPHQNGQLRMDCSYPSGVLRLWANSYKLSVPLAVSSTEIKLIERK